LRTLICVAGVAALLIGAPAALAHQGNPHYRSTVRRVTPAVPGLQLSVLNYDDRLSLHNTSGKEITVMDYQGKPYVRWLPDGVVQVNTNSQAYYLNVDRYGQVTVPKGLGTQPKWKVVNRDGRYDWHDHRIHWMSQSDPPGLKNKDRRQKIDDWVVPISVGGQKGAIKGSLTWVPLPNAPLPVGAIFAFAALVIVLLIGVFVVRRRRDAAASSSGSEPVAEAW
jgi:hypothetical protein